MIILKCALIRNLSFQPFIATLLPLSLHSGPQFPKVSLASWSKFSHDVAHHGTPFVPSTVVHLLYSISLYRKGKTHAVESTVSMQFAPEIRNIKNT